MRSLSSFSCVRRTHLILQFSRQILPFRTMINRKSSLPVLPRYADTIVIGGGTAGAAVAARLAERSDRTVLLLEAGPDYGALADGGWADELLDARSLPPSHDWGYVSA